ncbi:oxidoreductase C-terminal domain-containing protein [Mycobacterium sp. 050272]|uniref:oxidoreductase C-terminal domain-containing protein n=1 Tax=Mycobacterium sp. 050272 TaxID=3142488 RepID=UPI0031986653
MLRSVESLNRPGDHMAARKLLALGDCLTPEQASDLDFDLRAHITASTGEPKVREHRAPAPG